MCSTLTLLRDLQIVFPYWFRHCQLLWTSPGQRPLLTGKNNILGYVSRRDLARSKVCTYSFGSYYQTTFQNGCSNSVFYLEVGVRGVLFPQILARTGYYHYMLHGAGLKGKKRSCPITSHILYILDNLWGRKHLGCLLSLFSLFCDLPHCDLCHNLWVVIFFIGSFRDSLQHGATHLFYLTVTIFSQWDLYRVSLLLQRKF